jgi:hypothetical protein
MPHPTVAYSDKKIGIYIKLTEEGEEEERQQNNAINLICLWYDVMIICGC